MQGYPSGQTLGLIDLNLFFPLSAQFGLGRWKTCKIGRADMRHCGILKFKSTHPRSTQPTCLTGWRTLYTRYESYGTPPLSESRYTIATTHYQLVGSLICSRFLTSLVPYRSLIAYTLLASQSQ